MINIFSLVGYRCKAMMIALLFSFSALAQFTAFDCLADADTGGYFLDVTGCSLVDSFQWNESFPWEGIECDTCDMLYIVGGECCKDTSYHEWIFDGCPECACIPTIALNDPACPEYIEVTAPIECDGCSLQIAYFDGTSWDGIIGWNNANPVTYQYYPSTGEIIRNGSPFLTTTAFGDGLYRVTVFQCDGCDDAEYTLDYNAGALICNCTLPINITYSGDTTDSCDDLQFSASGGTAPYTWSSSTTGTLTESIDNSGFINSHNEGVANGTSPSGSYIVTATDANGCTSSLTVAYDKCSIYPDQEFDICSGSMQVIDCANSLVTLEIFHNLRSAPCWPFYTFDNVTINGTPWTMNQDPSFPVLNGTCTAGTPSGATCPSWAFIITGFIQMPHSNLIACTNCNIVFDLYADNIFLGNYSIVLDNSIPTCP